MATQPNGANPQTAVLEARSLTMQFEAPEGRISLFEDLDLSIAPGDSLAILGTSGSGKSTLLGLLAGLDLPTGGGVTLDGADLNALDEDARARQRAGRVGFVFQAFHLLPGLTALENVMLPAEIAGDSRARTQAREALERVGLAHRTAHYPAQLSGGEQQRVALARAFLGEPMILFADEPTGNLDPTLSEEIMRLFEQFNQVGVTTVIASHDLPLIERLGHRRIHLVEGRAA